MKSNLFIFLLFSCGSAQGKLEMIEYELFGRSLANYQMCSATSTLIADSAMHDYYQSMFNDRRVQLFSFSKVNAEVVYKTWSDSELILARLDQKTRVQICASRFDKLTRKVLATH